MKCDTINVCGNVINECYIFDCLFDHTKFTEHGIHYVLVDLFELDLVHGDGELQGQEMFTPHVLARDGAAVVEACA